MWHKIIPLLGQFPSAVLTGVDAAGYPFSLRCSPQVDAARQVLQIGNPAEAPIQPGPAGLLYHSHNDQLWDLKSIQILGRLERAGQGWVFHPERFIPGGGLMGPIDQMRGIFKARASAKRYLEKCGLPRPQVRWDEIKAVRAEIRKSG